MYLASYSPCRILHNLIPQSLYTPNHTAPRNSRFTNKYCVALNSKNEKICKSFVSKQLIVHNFHIVIICTKKIQYASDTGVGTNALVQRWNDIFVLERYFMYRRRSILCTLHKLLISKLFCTKGPPLGKGENEGIILV